MSDDSGSSQKQWIGLLLGLVAFIFLQVRSYMLKAKLAKAEAARLKLEQEIKQGKQAAEAEKLDSQAQAIAARVESREKRLEELYAKIGVLGTESKSVSEQLVAARKRLG